MKAIMYNNHDPQLKKAPNWCETVAVFWCLGAKVLGHIPTFPCQG